ncbi:MAG: hypothetical protein P1R58_08450 [bacterium]|nr:hypothetical protein [bacterium]
MSDQTARVGFDRRDDMLFAARVELTGERPQIKALLRSPSGQKPDHELLNSPTQMLSVPDELVLVKRLKLLDEHQVPLKQRASFEMSAAHLEKEELFDFDLIPTGMPNHQLILASRIERLAAYSMKTVPELESLTYRMRARALGAGYLNFCVREPGELICLADATRDITSVCLLYREHIVALFGIKLDRFNWDKEDDWPRILLEFRTILNFQLENLFGQGITVPLSAVVVGGRFKQQKMLADLSKSLGLNATVLKSNEGYFADPTQAVGVPLEDYIVALGLTVD